MKAQLLEKWNILRARIGTPTLVLIALVGCYVTYTIVRDWQMNRAIEAQGNRIEHYARESKLAQEKAIEHLSRADMEHQETVALLDTLKMMNDNIERLAENDRIITVKVNNLKNDYENARNQKRSTAARTNSNRPLQQRENDVLSADSELYPDN